MAIRKLFAHTAVIVFIGEGRPGIAQMCVVYLRIIIIRCNRREGKLSGAELLYWSR